MESENRTFVLCMIEKCEWKLLPLLLFSSAWQKPLGSPLYKKIIETLTPSERYHKSCLMYATQFEEEATEAQSSVMHLNNKDYKTPFSAN